MKWKPIKKQVAALLSGLTTTGVVTWADGLGWDVSQGWAALIVSGATVLAGYLTPDKRVSTTSDVNVERQLLQSEALRHLADGGFNPLRAVDAITSDDLRKLNDTGSK